MLALMSVATAAEGARDGRVRRGRRRRRRRHGARRGREAARRSRPAARCSASPICRRSPRWPRATSGSSSARTRGRGRAGPAVASAEVERLERGGAGGRSSAACWAPTPATAPPGDMPKSCSRPRRIRRIARSRRRPGASPRDRARATGRIEHVHARPARAPASRPPTRRARRSEVQRHRAARQAHEGTSCAAGAGRRRDHRPPRPRPHGGRGPRRVRRAGRSSTSRSSTSSRYPNPGPADPRARRRAARRRGRRPAVREARATATR